MTWRTSAGERILTGAEADLLRAALAHASKSIEDEIAGFTDTWEFGVVLFDRLEPSVKLALLAGVGWALLRETQDCPKLTAVSEAAIAALFQHISQSIQLEIDAQDELADPFYWRTRVLAVFKEVGDALELPDPECADGSEWDFLVDVLAQGILWDDDFDIAEEFLDAPPDVSESMRDSLSIDEAYFTAIPPDPRDADMTRVRARLAVLCGR